MINKYITSSITPLNSHYLSNNNTGLGNVMFQFASIYGISKSLNIKCTFPNIGHLATKLKKLYGYDHCDKIFRNIDINYDIIFDINYEENITHEEWYDEKILNYINNSDNNVMIHGYLGHISYFENYKDDILEIFKPDNESFNYIINKYFTDIEHYNIISIHFRLNDFSQQPEDNYYKNACNYILENVNNPIFYIFCDDITMVDLSIFKNLKYRIIDKEMDYIHLWIMSMCKHNIISYSTFSWWGAYLNKNNDKLTICNKKYKYNYNYLSIYI